MYALRVARHLARRVEGYAAIIATRGRPPGRVTRPDRATIPIQLENPRLPDGSRAADYLALLAR